MSYKLFGILGGMGPHASLKLCEYILEFRNAANDQEHLPFIMYNNPQIPDRSDAILNSKISPSNILFETAQCLERAGCHFLIMPCNTAHYFLDEFCEKLSIPFLNMIEIVFNYIKTKFKNISKIGMLATSGTVKSRIYHNMAIEYNIEIVDLDEDFQENLVMSTIYDFKNSQFKDKVRLCHKLEKAKSFLVAKGAQLIIAACSEIPLIMENTKDKCLMIDPVELLAKEAILQATT